MSTKTTPVTGDPKPARPSGDSKAARIIRGLGVVAAVAGTIAAGATAAASHAKRVRKGGAS